jgi:hypothetical protein
VERRIEMRLLTKLRKLELGRMIDGARERVIVPTGVMWTNRTGPDVQLAEGEEVVLDYKILSKGEGVTIADVSERATLDPSDFGKVFDSTGAEIGAVTKTEGGVVAYRLHASGAAEGAA